MAEATPDVRKVPSSEYKVTSNILKATVLIVYSDLHFSFLETLGYLMQVTRCIENSGSVVHFTAYCNCKPFNNSTLTYMLVSMTNNIYKLVLLFLFIKLLTFG